MSAYPARRIKVRGGLGSLRASTVARSHNITSRFGYVAAPRLYFNRASSSRQWRASSRSTPPLSPPSLNIAIKYLSFVMTFPLNVAKQRICVLGVLPLTWIKTRERCSGTFCCMEWKPISTAPFDRELELAVFDYDGQDALVFPCRRIVGSWINAETKQPVDVLPTHWREWPQAAQSPACPRSSPQTPTTWWPKSTIACRSFSRPPIRSAGFAMSPTRTN